MPITVEVEGRGGQLLSRLPVEDTAVASVATALTAAAVLHESRGGVRREVTVDRGQVAAAVRSERYVRLGDQPIGPGFAPLSRFFQAADGWVRTHANFPWHRAALLRALSVQDDPTEVARAIREFPAMDLEERVVEAGGVVSAVRAPEEWANHLQGRSVREEPLIGHDCPGEAPPRARPPGPLPASGVRVLDLTRVIAGPVATRFLGALGADVLRLDPPGRPDLHEGSPADTLVAKRSAFVDLTTSSGLGELHRLLDQADVVVCSYRPRSLDRFGLGAEDLAERHPGLVSAFLAAWGHSGPWSTRRGFDSIVQAACGIALIESAGGSEPGVLPCQLLDHGTGYLTAAAVLDGLRRQSELGGTHVRRLSLARTAHWLVSTPVDMSSDRATVAPGGNEDRQWTTRLMSAQGPLEVVGPPGRLDADVLAWPDVCSCYGADRPEWRSE